jgi:hypothetical protein
VREGVLYAFWPELMYSEARALRPVWNAAVTYAGGAERYLAATDKYYVALQASTNKSPDTETAYWREMTATELDLYLPWNPPDLLPLGTVKWVGKKDPVKYADQQYSFDGVASSRGWEIIGDGVGTKVWVQHRMRAPKFSRTTLGAGVEATLGQVIYQAADGECYQAIMLDGVKSMLKMQFPEFLSVFVQQGVLANDLRRDGQGERAAEAEGMAREMLEREWGVQFGQQQG